MAVLTVREVLDRLFLAWRTGDALYAAAHFAPGGSYQEAGREPLVGRERIAEHFSRFFRDGPLWSLDVDDVIVEGVRAAVFYRFAIEGTAGTRRERAGCAAVIFEGGAITAWREYEG